MTLMLNKRSSESGFVTMLVVMLLIVVAVLVLVFLRVQSTQQ